MWAVHRGAQVPGTRLVKDHVHSRVRMERTRVQGTRGILLVACQHCFPTAGQRVPRHHAEGGCLSCPIDTQQPETLQGTHKPFLALV